MVNISKFPTKYLKGDKVIFIKDICKDMRIGDHPPYFSILTVINTNYLEPVICCVLENGLSCYVYPEEVIPYEE